MACLLSNPTCPAKNNQPRSDKEKRSGDKRWRRRFKDKENRDVEERKGGEEEEEEKKKKKKKKKKRRKKKKKKLRLMGKIRGKTVRNARKTD